MQRCLRRGLVPIGLFGALMLLAGCASVPKEVVELSYVMGEDLVEVHESYVDLIELHFDDPRAWTEDFLDTRWQPVYLRHFIERGDLVDLEALKPQLSDQEAFDQLVTAVKTASAQNEDLAQLKPRIKALGEGVVAVAKEAAELL